MPKWEDRKWERKSWGEGRKALCLHNPSLLQWSTKALVATFSFLKIFVTGSLTSFYFHLMTVLGHFCVWIYNPFQHFASQFLIVSWSVLHPTVAIHFHGYTFGVLITNNYNFSIISISNILLSNHHLIFLQFPLLQLQDLLWPLIHQFHP